MPAPRSVTAEAEAAEVAEAAVGAAFAPASVGGTVTLLSEVSVDGVGHVPQVLRCSEMKEGQGEVAVGERELEMASGKRQAWRGLAMVT
jgi:hypothetical protein